MTEPVTIDQSVANCVSFMRHVVATQPRLLRSDELCKIVRYRTGFKGSVLSEAMALLADDPAITVFRRVGAKRTDTYYAARSAS